MIAYLLILAGFLFRLLPHAANFSPVAAIAIFSGAYLSKKYVPWVPLAIMILSDLVLGLHDVFLYTWGAFAITGYMGMWLKGRKNIWSVTGVSLAASLFFFIVTNFGVWVAWYPHTVQGLADCYLKAVPFLRNTVVSGLAYTMALFGAYELAARVAVKTRFKDILLSTKY
ncbi:MAG: hypothetical protein PHH49_00105 [Candidatus Omnitrophica bacterium]|nr:hypothetical protein [Candidatus Omnitrophota bacterium]MDD5487357.1 hypothetical protein [Candidatus Omnitrophota bacterium]